MKIAIVKKSDLSIASIYDADAPNQGAYGGPWGRDSEYAHVAIPEEMDHEIVKCEMDGEAMVFVVDEDKEDAKLARLYADIRAKRDAMLLDSDKYMLTDYPISVENKSLMEAYRNALRDLPSGISDPRDEVEYPVKPTV